MNEKNVQEKKTSEMSELFLMLDQVQQEYALGILRALSFAQNIHKTENNKGRMEGEDNEG